MCLRNIGTSECKIIIRRIEFIELLNKIVFMRQMYADILYYLDFVTILADNNTLMIRCNSTTCIIPAIIPLNYSLFELTMYVPTVDNLLKFLDIPDEYVMLNKHDLTRVNGDNENAIFSSKDKEYYDYKNSMRHYLKFTI